ncbi:MAG: hypothetical protein R3D02_00875 [Hyphomicrobiales bacterium]
MPAEKKSRTVPASTVSPGSATGWPPVSPPKASARVERRRQAHLALVGVAGAVLVGFGANIGESSGVRDLAVPVAIGFRLVGDAAHIGGGEDTVVVRCRVGIDEGNLTGRNGGPDGDAGRGSRSENVVTSASARRLFLHDDGAELAEIGRAAGLAGAGRRCRAGDRAGMAGIEDDGGVAVGQQLEGVEFVIGDHADDGVAALALADHRVMRDDGLVGAVFLVAIVVRLIVAVADIEEVGALARPGLAGQPVADAAEDRLLGRGLVDEDADVALGKAEGAGEQAFHVADIAGGGAGNLEGEAIVGVDVDADEQGLVGAGRSRRRRRDGKGGKHAGRNPCRRSENPGLPLHPLILPACRSGDAASPSPPGRPASIARLYPIPLWKTGRGFGASGQFPEV